MKIKLNYNRLVKIDDYPNNSFIDVTDGCSVRDLLVFLKLPSYFQKSVITRVNGEPVWLATVLKENDSVMLSGMLGGG